MSFLQSFKLALNTLRTSRLRSFLTMLGIIMGVAAVILILSLGNGLSGLLEQQVEKIGVNQLYLYDWGRGGGLAKYGPDRVLALVESRPDVFSGVTPWVNVSTSVCKPDGGELKKTAVNGVSEAMFNPQTNRTLDGDALAKGRYLRYVDVALRQNVCVVGSFVEQEVFRGDALGGTLFIGGAPYTVVGVMAQERGSPEEGGGSDFINIPYENALALNGSRDVSLYQITAVSRERTAEAKAVLKAALQDYYDYEDAWYDAYYINSMAEQLDDINALMAIGMAVLIAIAAISLAVGGIGIMNIMLVSVTERTREIGIRKSLGARQKDIHRQFIIEAGTTSALGGALGIALGCLASLALGALFGEMLVEAMGGGLRFNAVPTPGAVLVSFGVSVSIGMLFGYLPASKAAKLNPIDALRYE